MKIRLGTRNSALALVQAHEVKDKLLLNYPSLEIEIIGIVTTGDKITNQHLYDIGGKALFLKEIEEKLLSKEIDIAVHSLKDVPGILHDELELSAMLERCSPNDALISNKYSSIASLPKFAKIGTSSVRRKMILQNIRPDLQIGLLRGNVKTRIDKVLDGAFDASMLAMAGLKRLELDKYDYVHLLSTDQVTPAAGQGIITIEILKSNIEMKKIVQSINCQDSYIAGTAERSFLEYLDASCRTPIAAYVNIEQSQLNLDFCFGHLDQNDNVSHITKHKETFAIEEFKEIGKKVCLKLGIKPQ